MAKPLSKRLEKQIKKGMKGVEKTVSSVKPKKGPSPAKVAGVAGAAIAGAAGVAAAVHHLRRGPGSAATLHVRRNGDQLWEISAEGSDTPVGTYETKKAAVRAARKAAADAAPSDLVIHRTDGSVQVSHSY
jgi:hypothetical protein